MTIPSRRSSFGALAFLLILPLGQAAHGQAPPPVPTPAGEEPGPEALTRGPLHEAFAEPVVFDPAPGVVVPEAPPEAVEEMPPDQRPDGRNVQWINGYWAWDDERNDFLWVSGIWRDIPPYRQWVPGYWNPGPGGFRWVSGFWAPLQDPAQAQAQQPLQYLPEPPATLEAGPNIPSPTNVSIWVPGCWLWQQDRYVWRPGYWIAPQTDWIWVPAHYIWTPGGCVFLDGYWDYVLPQRGLVFAPVYFAQPVYARPNYVFAPSVTIVTTSMVTHFFARPSYGHYYYGDYYAARYDSAGYVPWFSLSLGRVGYDPLYAHYSAVQVRQDPGWAVRVREEYRYRRVHEDARPVRTYVAQRTIIERGGGRGGDVIVAKPLGQVGSNNVAINNTTINRTTNINRTTIINNAQPMKLVRVDEGRRAEMVRQARDLRQFREQRVRQEGHAANPVPVARSGGAGGEARRVASPRAMDLPRSPIASRPVREAPAEARREHPAARPGTGAAIPAVGPAPGSGPARPSPVARPGGRPFGHPGEARPGGHPAGRPHPDGRDAKKPGTH